MAHNFYENLKGFSRFSELTNPAHYVDVPPDWYVALTDIEGSTRAIEEGRYKDVNLAGAAAIIAILNMAGRTPLPYAFGGDGATMLIPPQLLNDTLDTLSAVQARIRSMFGFTLRAGCIPVHALYEQKARLMVAKYALSPHVSQAAFQGTGLSLAEQWLKEGGGTVMRRERKDDAQANLEGLECRWEPIENRNGTMVSLMVRVTPARADRMWDIYSELLRVIAQIYPDTFGANPTHPSRMQLSLDPGTLRKEAQLRKGRHHLPYLLKMLVQGALGRFSLWTGISIGHFNGRKYLGELATNTDSRKFDETLRMVLDSTIQQKERLNALLREYQNRGEIAYGLHCSPQALMTCLVFSTSGNHIHFVDGADGGYVLAAQQMKQTLNKAAA